MVEMCEEDGRLTGTDLERKDEEKLYVITTYTNRPKTHESPPKPWHVGFTTLVMTNNVLTKFQLGISIILLGLQTVAKWGDHTITQRRCDKHTWKVRNSIWVTATTLLLFLLHLPSKGGVISIHGFLLQRSNKTASGWPSQPAEAPFTSPPFRGRCIHGFALQRSYKPASWWPPQPAEDSYSPTHPREVW